MLKPIPKKDRPKVIALSVLATGLVGAAVVQFNNGDPRLAEASAKAAELAAKNGTAKGPAAGAAATAVRGMTPPGATGGVRAPGAMAASSLVTPASVLTPGGASATVSLTRIVGENGVVFDLGAVGPPTGGKDPFAPVGGAVAVVVSKPPVVAPSAPAAPPPAPDFGGGRLDNLLNKAGITSGIPKTVSRGGGVSIAEVMDGNGGGANAAGGFPSAASTVAVALPPPPPPAVMVTGIVMGVREPGFPPPSNVAVVRGADGGASASGERRFVKVGDSVGNGFVVAQVQASGIVIKSTGKGDKRRVTLHIGEKPAGSTGPSAAVAVNTSFATPGMGKDGAQNTDKNTNDKNTVPTAADVLKSAAAAASASATTGSAGSPLGETFRAK